MISVLNRQVSAVSDEFEERVPEGRVSYDVSSVAPGPVLDLKL